MNSNSVPTGIETEEALQAWAEQIQQEIAEIKTAIMPLQQRLDGASEKLDLVRRLIHLSHATTESACMRQGQPRSSQQAPSSFPAIEDHIEEVLRSAGKPMHIREIRDALIQKAVPLPGRGDEANIILRLRRDSDRFVRTGRGTYGITAWDLAEYAPAPLKKRMSRRKETSR